MPPRKIGCLFRPPKTLLAAGSMLLPRVAKGGRWSAVSPYRAAVYFARTGPPAKVDPCTRVAVLASAVLGVGVGVGRGFGWGS